MTLLLAFFASICYSQCWVDSTVNLTTSFEYKTLTDSSGCSSLVWGSSILYFQSFELLESNELLFDFRNYTDSIQTASYPKNNKFPYLKTVKIQPKTIYYFYIHLDNVQGCTNIYYGCFDEVGCESSSFPYVYLYSTSFTFFADETQNNKMFQLYLDVDNSVNENGYPFVFIGGATQRLQTTLEFSTSIEKLNSLSGMYYLCTAEHLEMNIGFIYLNNYGSYQDLSEQSVCSRKNYDRFVMFHKDHATYTNCSCLIQNEDTQITSLTLFNYPDCNYNSSLFDLTLPSLSNSYSLDNDYLEWFSIIFTYPNQQILMEESSTLMLEELNITQKHVFFNGNVTVKNLTLSEPGAEFNNLNFENIEFSSIGIDDILFSLNSTTTDFNSYPFEQVGTDYYINLLCIFDGSMYTDRSYNEFFNCSSQKDVTTNELSLKINAQTYSLPYDEYWQTLLIYDNLTPSLTGEKQLNANLCEFEDKTITIKSNLYCETLNVNQNTQIIVDGELSIGTLVFNGEIDNLNQNGTIISNGIISINSIELKLQQVKCIEVISSTLSLFLGSIISDYSTLLLSQEHLLRICPHDNEIYDVTCSIFDTMFEENTFDVIHCPCYDLNCTVNITMNQLDCSNVEFNGVFYSEIDTLVIVSNKTESFRVNIINDNTSIVVVGNGPVGFSQTTAKATSQLIMVSSEYLCNALIFETGQESCFSCKGDVIVDGICYTMPTYIDNCQLQNEFGCEICYEGYESRLTHCRECPSNCLRCYNGECINCEMNYQLNETNQCESITGIDVETFYNNKIMKCSDGYYSNINECIKCFDSNCITCDSLQCLICNTSFIITNDGTCSSIQKEEEIISNYGVIDCNDGYYSNNSQCIDCSLTFDNCEICDINGCLSCSNGVIINNGSCSLNTNCLNVDDSICLNCNDKGSWFNGNKCIECGDNCKNCINGYCIECNDGYILQSDNNCIGVNEYPDNCITISYYGTCQRCSVGYYLNNNLCYECSNECTTCHNLTYCFECNDGYMLNSTNECVDISTISSNCQQPIPGSSGGCAICNDGYYRNQTTCLSCISNCTECNNGESCLICESSYFLLNDASECISYDDLTNCETPTQSGCTKCVNNNYYLNNQYCILCSNTTENCNTCNNNGECLTCQNDYILINYECINYQLIDNCKESSDSKCSSCSFWHTVNSDQTGCDTQVVWWIFVFILLFILIIFIGICVLIWYVIKQLFNKRQQKKQEKTTTIFNMSRSNIKFNKTNNKDVVINKEVLLFDDNGTEIGVNEETRDLICVGNTSKHTIKVQFSVKDGCDKYEIRTNPQVISIPKGKAVEFEIFIKPLCTCSIIDQIMLISADLSKGKTITTPIQVNTITIMTTHLDYDELKEDIKLGEGGFGIVYKGTFRGNQVAIKVLKQANDDLIAMEEFEREVAMLDKFRNDYIVHFYGAVFIVYKLCMVTEFAQHGSLRDVMNKRKKEPISEQLKHKIIMDCSKGISYLHINGILHRDIKPDNFLIFSLDANDGVQVNAKLTDFGASRNINMLMTNMTFTSGIGTPTYMAPEVLHQKKYKVQADIYSFAITMFELFSWDEAYPHATFKFPWSIAEFVTSGKRLPKPDVMDDEVYNLITKCWCEAPKKRYNIDTIIRGLEQLK
ncbi:Protein serine/threonine kinase [Entamoeba marina]